MISRSLMVAALLAAIPPATAAADEELELGGFAGVHLFNDDNELGQDDYAAAGSLENAPTLGVRVSRRIAPMVSAEGELAIAASNMRVEDVDVVVFGWRVQGLYHPVRLGRFEPFALFGVGGSTAASSDTELFQNDTDLVVHAGLGARIAIGPNWGVRLDARLALPPSSDSESVTADGEILLGLWKAFGPPAPPPPPPGQPAPPCTDPADPRDGVEPVAEKPPAPPPQPSDGDGDGLLDDQDKCSKEPETANGFDDGDGCPDDLPPEVKKLTGVISGIQFVQTTAGLAPGSSAVLDETVAMLNKYPTVRIEIAGHTDSSGDEQKNRDLSQQRADAVRAYLVKRGIAEARLESKGYGPEFPIGNNATPEGRAQNRRVEFKLLSP